MLVPVQVSPLLPLFLGSVRGWAGRKEKGNKRIGGKSESESENENENEGRKGDLRDVPVVYAIAKGSE
jgi:hypothetical protein